MKVHILRAFSPSQVLQEVSGFDALWLQRERQTADTEERGCRECENLYFRVP